MIFNILKQINHHSINKNSFLATFGAVFMALCYPLSSPAICPTDAEIAAKIDPSHIIYCEIPDGLEIKENQYGYGIFTTKPFKNGEVIYENQFIEIEDEEQYFLLKTPSKDYVLNSFTHAVAISNGKRALYTFDSMMNHSCQANSYSITPENAEKANTFLQVACRDIAAGEEITCNYLLFEYDCSDKSIDNCQCESHECFHHIRGFKWLPEEKQIKLLPQVDSSVVEQYLIDHPDVIYITDLKLPEALELKGNEENYYLTSKRSFKKGEVVYENNSLFFEDHKLILILWKGSIIRIENKRHAVKRGEGIREFFYFDTFMNHSCDPNTITSYISPGHYQGIALKDIQPGDELTCDYTVFDTEADEDESFECHCGAANCKGIIR